MQYKIFTDGACDTNPGFGSYAYVAINNQNFVQEHSVYVDQVTTNNRMELCAVIEALKFVCREKHSCVDFFCDSEYVVKGITLWIHKWMKKGMRINKKKEVKNKDLWMELYALCRLCNKVTFHTVRGHTGVYGNELADKLCMNAFEKKCGFINKRNLKSGESFKAKTYLSLGFFSWNYANLEIRL